MTIINNHTASGTKYTDSLQFEFSNTVFFFGFFFLSWVIFGGVAFVRPCRSVVGEWFLVFVILDKGDAKEGVTDLT